MATSPAEVAAGAPPDLASGVATLALPSFTELYHRHFEFVWKCARAFGCTPQDVDDVVQDVFLVVQRRHADLRDESVARSWIYSITRRVVSSHRRRRRAHDPEVEVDALKSPDQSPLAAAEHSVELRALSGLLEGLDERKREVFVLSEILELSGREIAETIGVPMNTVYSRLRAAREEFDAAVQRHRKSLERRRTP